MLHTFRDIVGVLESVSSVSVSTCKKQRSASAPDEGGSYSVPARTHLNGSKDSSLTILPKVESSAIWSWTALLLWPISSWRVAL